MRYPADPPRVEEIVAVMRQAGEDRHGLRIRAVIAVLWRGGLRISEALALSETDVDQRRGSLLIRHRKNDKRREAGMDEWGFDHYSDFGIRSTSPTGPSTGSSCPSVRCSASSPAPRSGADGQRPPHAASSGGSPRRPGCGGGSRPTSYGTPTPSRWRTKGSRCRLSRGSSGMHTWGSRRSTSKESIHARSLTRSTTADRL
jgi:hypothetical protein